MKEKLYKPKSCNRRSCRRANFPYLAPSVSGADLLFIARRSLYSKQMDIVKLSDDCFRARHISEHAHMHADTCTCLQANTDTGKKQKKQYTNSLSVF